MNYGKKKKMAMGGKAMKDVPMDKKKNLGKLPEEVRNKMGFKKAGGKVKKMKDGGSTSKRKVDPKKPEYRDLLMRGKPKPIQKPKLPKMGDKPKATPMKKGGSTSKRKVDPNLTLREDVATQAMKKAGKTGAGLGAAIAKVKKEQGMKKGQRKAGGMIKKKKKMAMGGMAMKYKHGGKVGKKCPRDGIAMRGKTRA